MIPPIASQFVAGESAPVALEHARETNERDVGVILNLLGEHYHERESADEDAATYCELLDDIAWTDLRACLSVKPSQLGLDVDESVFRENLGRIVDRADEHGEFVWIDMEDHTTTDATLDAFEEYARETGGDNGRESPQNERTGSARREAPGATRKTDASVGLCVQANLKRTREDLERLADLARQVGESFEVLARALEVGLNAEADSPVRLTGRSRRFAPRTPRSLVRRRLPPVVAARLPGVSLEGVEGHVSRGVVLHVDPDEAFGGIDDASEVLLKRRVADLEADLARFDRDAGVRVALGDQSRELDVLVGVRVGVRAVLVVFPEEVHDSTDAPCVQLLDVREGRLRRLPRHEVAGDRWDHDTPTQDDTSLNRGPTKYSNRC